MTGDTSIDIAVGGVLMPFVIAVINQAHWNSKVRGAVAFLLCLASAAGLAALHGTLTWGHWRDAAVVVTGAAMVMYHALWKPSGLAPAVESATTIGGDGSPGVSLTPNPPLGS
jgi:hypothetical protein